MITFVYMGFTLAKFKSQNYNLKKEMINYIQENQILKTTLEKNDSVKIEKTDAFITFLTQSRDWAFQYIETVQNGLNDYIAKVDPILEYHKQFGGIVPAQPYKSQLDSIADSFDELKQLLPKEEQ